MSEKINDGGSAFPVIQTQEGWARDNEDKFQAYGIVDSVGGMTMRQYYKAQALKAANDSFDGTGIAEAAEYIGITKADYEATRDWPKVLAKKCAAIADAMIAEDEAARGAA